MTIGQRIKDIRKAKKITQNELAIVLKIDQSNVSDYENDKYMPSFQTIDNMRVAYNVDLHWLFSGEGSMFITDTKVVNHATVSEFIPNLREASADDFWELEISGDIQAGEPLPIMEYYVDATVPVSKTLIQTPQDYYCFRVNGDSMTPEVKHQDHVIICNKFHTERLDNKIIAVRTLDGITLKKLILDQNKQQSYLFPINSAYKPLLCTDDDKILGYLKLIIRIYPD